MIIPDYIVFRLIINDGNLHYFENYVTKVYRKEKKENTYPFYRVSHFFMTMKNNKHRNNQVQFTH